jgi:hypothetical protein
MAQYTAIFPTNTDIDPVFEYVELLAVVDSAFLLPLRQNFLHSGVFGHGDHGSDEFLSFVMGVPLLRVNLSRGISPF